MANYQWKEFCCSSSHQRKRKKKYKEILWQYTGKTPMFPLQGTLVWLVATGLRLPHVKKLKSPTRNRGKTLERPLDYKEIKPINPKGNQPWIFPRRTVAKLEAPVLWPPDLKSWLIGKDLDAGKDWGQKEKRVAEDDMMR